MADEVRCQNCDWRGAIADVNPLKRSWERVQPGDVMPAGECPECGSSAMLIDRMISENAHAIGNAEAHVANMSEAFKAADCLDQKPDEPVEFDGDSYTEPSEILERLTESALSIEVRHGWHLIGWDASQPPEEFRIVLTTGGPACQVVGDLGQHLEPEKVRIEWQDWGTPWTRLPVTEEEQGILERFASLFYFGE